LVPENAPEFETFVPENAPEFEIEMLQKCAIKLDM
jgi:hypothetical protein